MTSKKQMIKEMPPLESDDSDRDSEKEDWAAEKVDTNDLEKIKNYLRSQYNWKSNSDDEEDEKKTETVKNNKKYVNTNGKKKEKAVKEVKKESNPQPVIINPFNNSPPISSSSSSRTKLMKSSKESLWKNESKQKDTHKLAFKSNFLKKNEPILSNPFNLCNHTWKVLIYPPGVISNKYISVYLLSIESNITDIDTSIKTDFTIDLFNFKKSAAGISKFQSFEFTNKRVFSGFNEFFEASKIDESSHFKDGDIRINISLSVVENQTLTIPAYIKEHVEPVTKLLNRTTYQSLIFSLYFIPSIRRDIIRLPADVTVTSNISFQLQRLFYALFSNHSLSNDFFQNSIDQYLTTNNYAINQYDKVYAGILIDTCKAIGKLNTKFTRLFSLENNNKVSGLLSLVDSAYSDSDDFLQALEKSNLASTKYPPILSISTSFLSKLNTSNPLHFVEDFYISQVYPNNSKLVDSPSSHYILYSVWVHENNSYSKDVSSGQFYTFVNISCKKSPNDQWTKISSSNTSQNISFNYVLSDSNNLPVTNQFSRNVIDSYGFKRNISGVHMLVYILESEVNDLFNSKLDFDPICDPNILFGWPINTHSNSSNSPNLNSINNNSPVNSNSNSPKVPIQQPEPIPLINNNYNNSNNNINYSNQINSIKENEYNLKTEQLLDRIKELESIVTKITDSLLENEKKNESFQSQLSKAKQASDKLLEESENKFKTINTQLKSKNDNYIKEIESLKAKNTKFEQIKTDAEKYRKESVDAMRDREIVVKEKEIVLKDLNIAKKEKDLVEKYREIAIREKDEQTRLKEALQVEKNEIFMQLQKAKIQLNAASKSNDFGGNLSAEMIEGMDDPMQIINIQNKLATLSTVAAKKLDDLLSCSICMSNYRNITLLPCNHTVSCGNCAGKLKSCPICRTAVTHKVKSILS